MLRDQIDYKRVLSSVTDAAEKTVIPAWGMPGARLWCEVVTV